MSTNQTRELARLQSLMIGLANMGAEVAQAGSDERGLSLVFRYRGTGFRFTEREQRFDGRVAELVCEAPGGMAVMSLRPELSGERFDKLLGCTVDVELGDPEFDARFVLECAPREAAPLLLGTSVRQGLCALPIDDHGPRVDLSPVGLRVAWRGLAPIDVIPSVIDSVATLRESARGLFEGHPDLAAASPFRAGSAGLRALDPRARALDLRRLVSARRRFVTVVATATALSAAVIASVLGGQGIV